ncbi:MAG: hemolysin family protein [Anaerolineae bacterium]
MSEIVVPLVIISLLILLNGIFVAAEFSIVAVPPTRMTHLAGGGQRVAGRVLRILRNPALQNRYLATAQLGITVVSLGLGMYGEQVVAGWFLVPLARLGGLGETLAHSLATVLAIGALTYLHVVLGEMVPKSLALQFAERTVLNLVGPMALLERLMLPVVAVFNGIGGSITRLLGIPPAGRQARLVSPEELELIVEESFEGGLIEAAEQRFIENIFDLHERTAGQVMTPRTRIVGLPATATESEVLRRIYEAHYSRYPIYEENLDAIIGVLHLKDLARHRVHPDGPFDLRQLARPPIFVPESLSLEQMLIQFQRERIQLAVIIDEFGGTAGLVTLEDLIEEVVGEIQDEFDQELPLIEEIKPGQLRVRGDLILDELNQLYDLDLDHPEADTVGGLLMASLGRIPRPGDVTHEAGVTFQVEAIEGLAVQTALVELPPAGDTDDGV